MKVANILKVKGKDVITAHPHELITTLAKRIKLARIGALVVTGQGGEMVGIISERDVVYALAEHDSEALTMTVGDLMTREVRTCSSEDDLGQVSRIMTENRVRHLPVLEGGKLIGMISLGDVVKIRMDEMSLEANVLRDVAIGRG